MDDGFHDNVRIQTRPARNIETKRYITTMFSTAAIVGTLKSSNISIPMTYSSKYMDYNTFNDINKC